MYLASTSKHITIKPRLTTKHGNYFCSNYKGHYYVTKGNTTVRVNPHCYACFLQEEVKVTYRTPHFIFYGGFENTNVGKRFLIIEGGDKLKLKYMKEMDDAINIGLVSTYIKPFWYYLFLESKYYISAGQYLTPEETKLKVEARIKVEYGRVH